MQKIQTHRTDQITFPVYEDVFWPVLTALLLLITALAFFIDIYYGDQFNAAVPFVANGGRFLQSVVSTNIWLLLFTLVFAVLVFPTIFLSVHDVDDGPLMTSWKTVLFFACALILIGTVYSIVEANTQLNLFTLFIGSGGGEGILVGFIFFGLVLAIIPARYTSAELRPMEQPGYLFVIGTLILLGLGLLIEFVRALFVLPAIYYIVVDRVILRVITFFQSMSIWYSIGLGLNIALGIAISCLVLYSTDRRHTQQAGGRTLGGIRKMLIILFLEALLLVIMYQSLHMVQPLQQTLANLKISDQEFVGMLVNTLLVIVLAVSSVMRLHLPWKAQKMLFSFGFGAFILCLLNVLLLGAIYTVVHAFFFFVSSWSAALPVLVAIAAVLVSGTLLIWRENYLLAFAILGLAFFSTAYTLITFFVVFYPAFLHLDYFTGSWWLALLLVSPAIITALVLYYRTR